MRVNYSNDEDFTGQFALWDANCRRSIQGRIGQHELRILEEALLALPEKRLIHGLLRDDEGGVCAIGAYAKHKGIDLSKFDSEDESDQVGIAAGMPRLVAWKVVALNDVVLDGHYMNHEGPEGRGRFPGSTFVPFTPEERYEKVLAWVREQLK